MTKVLRIYENEECYGRINLIILKSHDRVGRAIFLNLV